MMTDQNYTQFIIVRHCETAWNEKRLLQGQTDIPLNEKGHAQAKELGEQFADYSLEAIYASTLTRASQTAEAIAAHHGIDIVHERDLRETHFGEAEGLSYEAYEEKFGKLLEVRRSLPLMEGLKLRIVPNGECYFDVMQRVRAALDSIAPKHLGNTVLVVTHGGILKSLLMHLCEIDGYSLKIPNGGHLTLKGNGQDLFLTGCSFLSLQSTTA